MISFGYWANTCTVVDLGTLKSENNLKQHPSLVTINSVWGKSTFSAKNVSTNMDANISLSYLLFDFLCVCSVEKSTSALLSTKAFKNSEPGILTLQFKKKKIQTHVTFILKSVSLFSLVNASLSSWSSSNGSVVP